MTWIENKLTLLEAHLRAMIEGETARSGIPRKMHTQLVRLLVRAMLSEVDRKRFADDQEIETFAAPDQYTLVMPVARAQVLLAHPTELDRLSQHLERAATQAKLQLAAPPMLRVVSDPTARQVQIVVEYSHAGVGDSYTTELDGMPVVLSTSQFVTMPRAFLIVNGVAAYQLVQPVINIGSDSANHLVLPDPGVSGMHAQLRFITNHFVIFNLDSRGGTFVNGVAVSSHVLNPGDVIMLAGVPLIYGQETASGLGYTQELPVEPPTPEVL